MNLFDYPQSYPTFPGYRNTDTSQAAANDIAKRISPLQALVLRALDEYGPLATFEIAEKMDRSYRSIQPRTTELRLDGKIKDSGERRIDPASTKSAIVWEIVD